MSISDWTDSTGAKPQRVIYGELSNGDDAFLKVITKVIGHMECGLSQTLQYAETSVVTRLRLFNLNMPGDDTLEGTINYERDQASRDVNMGFYTAYQVLDSSDLEYRNHKLPFETSQGPTNLGLSLHSKSDGARLVELGVYCTDWIPAVEMILPLIKIAAITIKPKAKRRPHKFSIKHLAIIEAHHERRLTWEWQGSAGSADDDDRSIPWSRTTGPFSHFIIFIDGKKVGTAHCLQFPLRDEEAARVPAAEIRVDAILFRGGTVSSKSASFT